jgi:predicted RNA-binding Zn ribbon-like protein
MDTSPFRFRGENLALDLVNTQVTERGKPKDLLASPDEIERWWRLVCGLHPDRATINAPPLQFDQQLGEELRRLRGHLRRLVIALTQQQKPDQSDLDALNTALATGHLSIQPTEASFEAAYVVPEYPYGAMLYPIAESMGRLLTQGDLKRLHKCSNERCILFFYDTTRSATRRYCCLKCLERARSSEHYRQRKEQAREAGESSDLEGRPAT